MSPATDTGTRMWIVFRSVDSQPKSLSVPVSPLRAPALLLTFALLFSHDAFRLALSSCELILKPQQ